jgi:hypothetical protein
MTAIPANQPASEPERGPSRLRRWMAGLLVVAVLLGAYAYGLRWFTQQVGQDVQETLRDVPVLDDHSPRSN